MSERVKVSEWEKTVGYGTHRICKNCGFSTVNYDDGGFRCYIHAVECAVKKSECGSGAVKQSHSCACWKARV